jgi:hypothetical protein
VREDDYVTQREQRERNAFRRKELGS